MDSNSSSKIIDFQFDSSSYDDSNPLVLPANKNKPRTDLKTDKKRQLDLNEKVLSKKRRKELERKLSQKNKKLTRGELWKELEEYKTNENANKISVLPLFSRVKRTKTVTNKSSTSLKGKSWHIASDHEYASSKSTDEYSTDEEDTLPRVEHTVLSSENVAVDPGIPKIDEYESKSMDQDASNPEPSVPRKPMYFKPANFVLVSRKPAIEMSRLALPILSDETTIMDNINNHDCVIICGATGCGKTTQVPQFLFEAGYSSDGYIIGVTEPRRVAAVSMSSRVGEELNLKHSAVSYHIRFDKTVAPETKIKFMTDGILLQEIKQDFELSKYSAIIVDEAHERSIYTDVLLGLLSMIVRLRRRRYSENVQTKGRVLIPLKLIIMSATLRVADFSENRRLFPPSVGIPPVVQVESRQFPVTCHFAKITHSDYLKAAFKKVISIHRDSPAGGILVFVTGRQEAHTLCGWLTRTFQKPTDKDIPQRSRTALQNDQIESSKAECQIKQKETSAEGDDDTKATTEKQLPTIDLDSFDIIPADEESEVGHLRRNRMSTDLEKQSTKSSCQDKSETSISNPSYFEDDNLDEVDYDDEILAELAEASKTESPVAPIYALPLYSLLPPERQKRVFQPPPEGHRLVIVSTNVAETSLTIPDIRFVVDTGKVKSKVYDPATGAGSFEIVWISQASAEQRAGRAGRVGPGHCYRLYSSQVFSRMQKFPYPDILLRPIDEVVLMLKSYLGTTPLSLFPLPTPPSTSSVDAAEHRLISLGALEEFPNGANGPIRSITRAGRWMSRLPVPARFGRMLLFANQHQLMPYAVTLVAALTVPDLFLPSGSVDPSKPDDNTTEEPKTDQTGKEDALSQFRTNFVQQFVRRSEDLLLGDLSVLLGTICCLERYYAQMTGLTPPEPGIVEFCGGLDRVKRDPDGAMRVLVNRCGVRWNAYREVRQLRRQLTDILNANIPNLDLTVDPTLARPSPEQTIQLCQLFLVGSPSHVASKLSVSIPGLPTSERRRLRYAYEIPGRRDPVFIEPNSPLARENNSFIAYLELFVTSKPFLRTVCTIDPTWLPFLAPHSILVDGLVLNDEGHSDVSSQDPEKTDSLDIPERDEDEHESDDKNKPKALVRPPTPKYDSERDLIVTGAKSIKYIGSGIVDAKESLGDHSFLELPQSIVMVPINSPASIRSLGLNEAVMWSVRWFLRFILEGTIFPELKRWFPSQIKKSLSPQLVTVSWGIIRPQVKTTSSVLFEDKIDTRSKLIAKLKIDQQYLAKELASWIINEAVDEFHAAWPPSCICEQSRQSE